jgi:hypothetical protein
LAGCPNEFRSVIRRCLKLQSFLNGYFIDFKDVFRSVTGVTGGFAGMKLSGALKMFGSFRVSAVSIVILIANRNMSFTAQEGWGWDCWLCFCVTLVGYLSMFGVDKISVLQLQMVLGSAVRYIV